MIKPDHPMPVWHSADYLERCEQIPRVTRRHAGVGTVQLQPRLCAWLIDATDPPRLKGAEPMAQSSDVSPAAATDHVWAPKLAET